MKLVLEMPTISQRRESLEILPTSLYDSFRDIIARIRGSPNASHAELGMQVLMWLHFAYRPLKLVELQHALAVSRRHTEFDSGNTSSRKSLLDYCLGLVVVDEETLTVRFVHYTLEEYFHKYTGEEFPNGCIPIAETCLTYLNFSNLRQHCTSLDELRANETKYAFLNYAALYWGMYLKQQCNDELMVLAKAIVEHEIGRPPCAIQVLYSELGKSWFSLQPIARRFSGVHATAYFGLSEEMAYCCEIERNMDLRDESDRTPLSWAAEYGHENIVRMLIAQNNVDINSSDSKYGKTPLLWAAEKGHEAVTRLLTERCDLDIVARDRRGQTALLLAAEKGHEGVVLLLLMERGGVAINTKDNIGWTPLLQAARSGQEAIVWLLLQTGNVDINARNRSGWTPLSLAAQRGHEAIVRLLIERNDVNINVQNIYGQTALWVAAEGGHEAVVRLLIEREDVDVSTALSLAAANGHEAVVRLLIERDGVDANARDMFGWTPLLCAAVKGQEAVVRLLIERDDADINPVNDAGLTPLLAAADKGYENIVRLLTEKLFG